MQARQRSILMLVILWAAAAALAAPLAETGQPPAGAAAAAARGLAPGANASLAAAAAPAPANASLPASAAGLLVHNGQPLFLTGVNLGNVQLLPFAGNPYGYTPAKMRSILADALADIASTGANSIRLWLHIDGSRSPAWGPDQAGRTVVTGLPPGLLDDLRWLLAAAYDTHGLLVAISLWSHDILAVRQLNGVANRARAVLMMTDDAATDAYVRAALLPLLRALDGRVRPGGPRYADAVVAIEVVNEPEGLARWWRLYKNYMYLMRFGTYQWWNPRTYQLLRHKSVAANWTRAGGNYTGYYFYQEDGTFNNYMLHDVIDNYPSEWDFLKAAIVDTGELTTVEVPYQRALRFINRVAGAIHRALPGMKVTVGLHSVPYATAVPMPGLGYDNAPFDYYSDAMLVSAGGDPQGTLDFVQAHGYPLWDEPLRDANINMFLRPKAHWRISKPLLVGEHWEQVMARPSLATPADYVHLHDTGYAGAWGWAWFNASEAFDYTSGIALGRSITEHKCRGSLRSLLASLPQRLKYPVRREAPAADSGAAQAPSGAAAAPAADGPGRVFGR